MSTIAFLYSIVSIIPVNVSFDLLLFALLSSEELHAHNNPIHIITNKTVYFFLKMSQLSMAICPI